MIIGDACDINVEAHLSYPTSNTEGRYVSIRLTDQDSCIQFVELKIPFDQFTALLASSLVVIPATMRGLDRVGKRMETGSAAIGHSQDEAERVKSVYINTGWDTAEIRRLGGSGGLQVIARRWVDKSAPTTT
jgi:hypothetical protein